MSMHNMQPRPRVARWTCRIDSDENPSVLAIRWACVTQPGEYLGLYEEYTGDGDPTLLGLSYDCLHVVNKVLRAHGMELESDEWGMYAKERFPRG